MDVDEVMGTIGEFGPFQKKIVYFLGMVQLVCGLHALIFSIVGESPGWFCPSPSGGPGVIVRDSDPAACKMFDENVCVPQFHSNFTSIVTEWNLVCRKSNLPKLSQSAFFVGFLLGAWIWGSVADKIGRKKVFFITCGCLFLSGFGCGFSFSYCSFVIFRVCAGISNAGVILSSYVLSVEIVGVSGRSFAGILGSAIFSLAYPLLAVLAYFIRNWRALFFLISVVGTSTFALIKTVPESPRWLATSGHLSEAESVLSMIAQGNGTVMPLGMKLKHSSGSSIESNDSVGIRDMFSGQVIRKRILLLFLIWFTVSMVYYALAMSTGELMSNRYISFALSGLVEIPALMLVYKMMSTVRFGRKWTHGVFLLSSGVACLMWTLLYWSGNKSLGTPFALLGKFAVAAAFGVIYLYSAELFPTQVRNIGLGVTSVGARLGGILAPIVLMTAQYSHSIPMLLMGILALGTGLLSLTLPETLNKPMPDTLKDLENL